MTFTLPDKITDEEAKKVYIQNIIDLVTDHTMVIFIDDSAQDNPGPVGSGNVIKKQGIQSSPIKLPKAVTPHGSSYASELEAIKLGTIKCIWVSPQNHPPPLFLAKPPH